MKIDDKTTETLANANVDENGTENTVGEATVNNSEDDTTLKRDAYPKINALIKDYYEARTACDLEKLGNLMNNSSAITMEMLQNEAEYIEEYKNIECYTLPGPEENSYVVYVYQEYKIAGIDTLAPGMKRFYIHTDETGRPYIYIGAVDDKIKEQIDKTAENKEVINLITNVEKKLLEAMTKDAALNEFQKNLEKEAKASQEATSKAEKD